MTAAPALAPEVTAIVLNHVETDDTLRCVAALRRSTMRDLRIVVVDNGSPADARRRLRDGLDRRVEVVETGENLGYAAGNNVAIGPAVASGTRFVWIVNPDLVVAPDTLGRMVQTARTAPDAGCVGSRVVLGGSDPPRIWFDGGRVDRAGGGGSSHPEGGRFEHEVPPVGVRDVDFVTGANLLVRREVFEEVGLLPEEYFLYFEETDFQVRARRRGWRSVVDTTARAVHHKRSAARTPAPYYVYYYVRARLLFRARHAPDVPESALTDLTGWITAWRANVEAAAPEWLDTYDRLVELALADGRAGRTGRRADIDDVAPAEEEPRVPA